MISTGLAISKRIFQHFGDEHEIYFLVDKKYAGKLKKINPKIKSLVYSNPSSDIYKNSEEFLIQEFEKFGKTLEISDRVEFVNSIANEFFEVLDNAKAVYPEISQILKELKPDRE